MAFVYSVVIMCLCDIQSYTKFRDKGKRIPHEKILPLKLVSRPPTFLLKGTQNLHSKTKRLSVTVR
ncbi:hypothetical protein LEP1GSC043_0659 [Leptospira weilii str. Ecochallenge]|uniref:Uncharacterized protein n=1 Tax=Leptospira weilii str. Ecochallenge TaxID=1049986 RepID=N1U3X6_9LEPT|nr:hypothetical protein LEP1GSC043_0659 [Leptospira weilii str. Ecochallenge]